MRYKSYSVNLTAVKYHIFYYLMISGKHVAVFPTLEDCDNFVAEFFN